jgi:hypothetical protein
VLLGGFQVLNGLAGWSNIVDHVENDIHALCHFKTPRPINQGQLIKNNMALENAKLIKVDLVIPITLGWEVNHAYASYSYFLSNCWCLLGKA